METQPPTTCSYGLQYLNSAESDDIQSMPVGETMDS